MDVTDSTALDVWRVNLDEHQGFDLLSDDERKRADRFLIAAKRHEFTVARSALRQVLARRLERSPESLVFELGEHGRPELPDENQLNFNLSHSEGVALIALAPVEFLGVDVERRRDGRPFGRLAQRFFSTLETRDYQTQDEPDPAIVFYRGWTRKEAYLKAWGTGLTFSSRRFSLSLGEEAARVLETGMPGDDGAGWTFADLDLGASHAACVCWRGSELAPRLRAFET